MRNRILFSLLFICVLCINTADIHSQAMSYQTLEERFDRLESMISNLRHRFDVLEKISDDVLWYHRVGDVAYIDKVRHTGPPPANVPNPTAKGAHNPVRFYSYVFIPKWIDREKKHPLIVFPHGGVHSNFNTYYTHIIRELMAQGYVVIASEYRGSTGYGRATYELIDYGGLEIQDVHAGKDYMLENYKFVDKNRVGIMGWSHGGLITLMNIFFYPKDYKAAYAGVPVSDLVARMGYMTQSYREYFEADYHIGKSAHEDVQEYRRRSPAWHAEKLETPLLIYTNTNDEDVNVLEVEHLIKSLKAADKKFEYKVFQDAPGGHSFDRLDNILAKEARVEIYKFLTDHLRPQKRLNNVDELMRAGYR